MRDYTTDIDSAPVRLVLDTNVWIALASHRSYIYQFLFGNRASIKPFKLYTSPQQMIALQNKLVGKFKLPQPQAVEHINSIRRIAETVYPRIRYYDENQQHDRRGSSASGAYIGTIIGARYLEECAAEAKAEAIISANKKLIKSKNCAGVLVIHPAQLLAREST